MKKNQSKIPWHELEICLNFHRSFWVSNDRENIIDSILEDNEIEPSWYCPMCKRNYTKSKYSKYSTNLIDDSGSS